MYVYICMYTYSEATFLCVYARVEWRGVIEFLKKGGTHLEEKSITGCAAWWCYRKSSFDGGKWGINGVAEICEYIYIEFSPGFRICSYERGIFFLSRWDTVSHISLVRLYRETWSIHISSQMIHIDTQINLSYSERKGNNYFLTLVIEV